MSNEFVLEVFFIRIRVISYLRNITEKKELKTDTFGIKNKNKISYHHDDMIVKIEIKDKSIHMTRENQNFSHTFEFKLNAETTSEYYIKEYNTSLEVKVLTTKLSISDNNISINYTIKDSNEEYSYILDME